MYTTVEDKATPSCSLPHPPASRKGVSREHYYKTHYNLKYKLMITITLKLKYLFKILHQYEILHLLVGVTVHFCLRARQFTFQLLALAISTH